MDVRRIAHDAKAEQGNKPDFVVLNYDIPILYIETKDIGISLDKVEKSEQMRRYYGNTNGNNIHRLREACLKINPDKIQLNTLDRPGTVKTLKPVSIKFLIHIQKLLNLLNTEIISKFKQIKKIKTNHKDIEQTILDTISRRLLAVEDASSTFGISQDELNILKIIKNCNLNSIERNKS